MNDALYREIVFAGLGALGGFVRAVIASKAERNMRAFAGNVLLGAGFAAAMPTVCLVVEDLVRYARHPDLSISGGFAIIAGLFGFNVITRSGDFFDGMLKMLCDSVLKAFASITQRLKNKE